MKEFPQQLIKDLQPIDGFNEAAFLAAHEKSADTSIRLHPVKGGDLYTNEEVVPWCPSGRYLKERPSFTLDPYFHAGAYYVQEASSQFLDYMLRQLLPERNGLRVLDLCAAPGGKSTLIASLLGKDSLLVANEVIRSRASILEENITRWGYMNTWVSSNDAKDFGKLKGYFDVIVVDAPCSGSGLFRKDERALDEWSPANVDLCSQRQDRVLADVWSALKEDGILIYSTCSYSQQEDEDVADRLSESFEVEGIDVPIKEEWGIVATRSPEKGIPGYRFFPDRLKGEGFFITAMRKKSGEANLQYPKFRSAHDKKMHERSSFLLNGNDWHCVKVKDEYCAMNAVHEADYHLLQKHIYLRKTGVVLGAPGKNEWIPAHDVSLSIERANDLQSIEVSKEQALKFLKKEDAGFELRDKGWYFVSFEGLGLGWVKSLGNRYNNYLPKHWRIRMDIDYSDWE